eukprot:14278758-Heterocapsa_arctica.AAC.1
MGIGHHGDFHQIHTTPSILDHVCHHWGTTARRAPEATFAIVATNSWLDPDLYLTANVIGGW